MLSSMWATNAYLVSIQSPTVESLPTVDSRVAASDSVRRGHCDPGSTQKSRSGKLSVRCIAQACENEFRGVCRLSILPPLKLLLLPAAAGF